MSDALAIVHGEGGETHVAILVAIGRIVVIAFRGATDGTFSVSSAVECELKDSKIVRKDFNIAEVRSKTSRYRSCRREGAFFRECRGI